MSILAVNDFYNQFPCMDIMAKMQFDCKICGAKYGRDLIGLARHIRVSHDAPRKTQ